MDRVARLIYSTDHPKQEHFEVIVVTDVTALLSDWNSGDPEARAQVMERIYSELGVIASRYLAREGAAVELQPTALVHEAYLKLAGMNRVDWEGRAHFLAMAARLMREYLIDTARRRRAAKRDGGIRVTLSGTPDDGDQESTDILALNEALDRLAKADPDRALIVELRFFGGLTVEETAEVTGQSPSSIKRSWRVARGWLYQQMHGDADT